MEVLTYSSPPELASVAAKAAAAWNDVLHDLVAVRLWQPSPPAISSSSWTAQPDIRIEWKSDVRTKAKPDRVGYCQRVGPSRWIIGLDQTIKWAVSPWARFFGNGENALACLVHELGHVFKMPHASDPSFVMHAETGGRGKMSRREKALYRSAFLGMLEDEK
jgi:hypothetical protein